MENKYNVLIVGAGSIGAFFDKPTSQNTLTHAHAFSKSQYFNLVGFVETDYIKAEQASKIWNTRYFCNLEEAFRYTRVDVVSLCVPDEFHFELLKKITDYSVRLVFAEKPLAKTVKEAEAILQLYEKTNIKCLVNYSRRFVPEFQKLKNEILSGCYGQYVSGNGYYGKGTVHNGSHMIDFLRFLVGEIKESMTFKYNYDFYEDDPSVSAILKFINGRTFTINSFPCNNYTIFEIELLFQKARIRIIDSGFKIEVYEVIDSPIFQGYKSLVKKEEINTSLGDAMTNAAINIFDHLRYNENLKCTLKDGLRAIEICEKLKDGITNE